MTESADLEKARELICNSYHSIVVIKDGNILTKKQGEGIQPFLQVIDELGPEMENSTIGDRTLGKASALLCAYAKIKEVYAPQITKTGLAVLLQAGIPGQTDKIIPYITNQAGNDRCPYEKLLERINDPKEAYTLLQQKISKIKN